MVQECKVNKDIDLGYTIPDLHIDIADAVETGKIRSTNIAVDTYNLMQSTDEVGSSVRDGFTALDYARSLDSQVYGTNPSTQTE